MMLLAAAVLLLGVRADASSKEDDCTDCYGLSEEKCAEKYVQTLSLLPGIGEEKNRLDFFRLIQSKEYQFAFHEDELRYDNAQFSDEECLATFESALRRIMIEDRNAVLQLIRDRCEILGEWSLRPTMSKCCPGLSMHECEKSLSEKFQRLPDPLRLDVLKTMTQHDVPACFEDTRHCLDQHDDAFSKLCFYDRLSFLVDSCDIFEEEGDVDESENETKDEASSSPERESEASGAMTAMFSAFANKIFTSAFE